MALTKHSSSQAGASTREFKHRVLTCLNKLSDRDTHSAAATELESIAKTLSHDSIQPFISSISATDSSDKSPVRKQCVRLISIVSETHGNALSPYLSKLLSSVVRRLRDPDSAVRSACINAIASISSHITKPPFTSIAKPLIDALVTEQDQNSQIGAALCLASAIDASPDPEALYLRRLMPKLEKLLKCESFKAKPALLTVVGSVIGAGVAESQVRNLVQCLVEFVSSEDWAARKAAAEVLVKLAVVEREMLSEFKSSCLKTFEAKKFDKVKVVRETMNLMVEAWKEIPDVVDELSQPPEPQTSSKEVDSDLYPSGSKTSRTISSGAPQIKKKHILTPAQNRGPLDSTVTRAAMFRKLDRKKGSKFDTATAAAAQAPSVTLVSGDDLKDRGEKCEERSKFTKREIKRVLFDKNYDEKVHKFGGSKAGSRVVPCVDEMPESTAVASYVTEDVYRNHKESEDLSLIRKQLVQIENQQSSLLGLLQGFIGSSQNGMRSLESRVHGLELALDEISFDLAVSTGRMSNSDAAGAICCKLPGADFLSSKLWRRTEGRYSTSRFSSSAATPPVAAICHKASKNGENQTFEMENRKFRLQGGGGFVVNPLAKAHSRTQGLSELSSNRVSKNLHGAIRHSSTHHLPDILAGIME